MKHEIKEFRAHGKLMLFGEYVVMRNVPALAFPIKLGQTLTVHPSDTYFVQSFEIDECWFSMEFSRNLEIKSTNNLDVAEKLISIFEDLKSFNEKLFELPIKLVIQSNFNRKWGFGSSATLISLLAQWSGMNPFDLNEKHFEGSGYDIACATASSPIIYTKSNRIVQDVSLPKSITDKLLFIYLGKKQNSRNEVNKFNSKVLLDEDVIFFTDLILGVPNITDIVDFEQVINSHEEEMSKLLERPTLKEIEFFDYEYSIKSMGAWGGDFFMATCRNLDEARMYFIEKGKEVCFTWEMLAL